MRTWYFIFSIVSQLLPSWQIVWLFKKPWIKHKERNKYGLPWVGGPDGPPLEGGNKMTQQYFSYQFEFKFWMIFKIKQFKTNRKYRIEEFTIQFNLVRYKSFNSPAEAIKTIERRPNKVMMRRMTCWWPVRWNRTPYRTERTWHSWWQTSWI